MFVDINMPDLSGMDFVKSLNNPPKVIFTTAYSEHAVEGFRVDAIDYLLKPIGYSRFFKSSRKGQRTDQCPKGCTSTKVESDDKFLFIKSEYKILRINLSDIKYIESMREYLRIHIGKPASGYDPDEHEKDGRISSCIRFHAGSPIIYCQPS